MIAIEKRVENATEVETETGSDPNAHRPYPYPNETDRTKRTDLSETGAKVRAGNGIESSRRLRPTI